MGGGPIQRLAKYCNGRVELWLTPCILSMPPVGSSCVVIPSNERLCGTQFSHFPKGGPTPSAPTIGVPPNAMQKTRRVSQSILYPSETVDGAASELGGSRQQWVIQENVPIVNDDETYPIRCPIGDARSVPAVNSLSHFDALILTVAPFWPGEATCEWTDQLKSSYLQSFRLGNGNLAVPLLGAGARGAPLCEASKVAAESVQELIQMKEKSEEYLRLESVCFSVLDEDVAEELDEAFRNSLS